MDHVKMSNLKVVALVASFGRDEYKWDAARALNMCSWERASHNSVSWRSGINSLMFVSTKLWNMVSVGVVIPERVVIGCVIGVTSFSEMLSIP